MSFHRSQTPALLSLAILLVGGCETPGDGESPDTSSACASDSECPSDEYCDAAAARCMPDVCDPTAPGDRRVCNGLMIQRCRDNGSGYVDESICTGGRACIALDEEPYAQCQCVTEGQVACESLSLGADVYEVDSCGNRLRRVDDCTVARRERCIDDELGVRCSAPVTCTTSADCFEGDYCADGLCVPDVCTPPPISNPNSRRFCDGNTVKVCAPDGSGYVVVDACGDAVSGQVCLDLPSDPGAVCRCVAGGLACHDTDVWFYDSCSVFTSRLESCDGSLECLEGPAGPACELRTTCARDFDCGVGRLCDDGLCVAPVCSAGEERCTASRAERCDARGTGWETLDDCVGGEVCAVAGGTARCECTANIATACAMGDVYNVDSCGKVGSRLEDCAGSFACVAGPTGPSCVDTTAPPTLCLGDDDCGSGEACLDGACLTQVCSPTATFCEAGAARRCNSSGSESALIDACDGGRVCSTASGAARCACVANVREGCYQGDVYTYDSCGGRGAVVRSCAGSCVEIGGTASCVTPPPDEPPPPSCTARASEGCYLGDLYWFDSCGSPDERAEECPGAVFCNAIGGPAACRSSVADTSSPYWDRSCPLVQDIELPTALEADCRCFVNRTPSGGIDRCTGALYVPAATHIGAGPSLRDVPQSQFWGGVIVGRELFVGAGWSSASNPRQGLVMAVNLDTGDRRIVSGAFVDPSTGYTEIGSGPSFARVVDVQRGPDGALFALSVPNVTADLEIIRVDPTSGARTLVWRARDDAFGQCASGDSGRLAVTYHDRVFGITPAGEFYLAFRGAGFYSEGVGLVRVSADGASCAFVTRSGAGSLNAYATSDIGTGYHTDRGYYSGMVQRGGLLYVLNDVYKALFTVNPATGNRTRVSSAATSWGTLGAGPTNFGGIGQRWLAWDEGRSVMWASGLIGYRGLTAIDLTTGDRIEAYCRAANAVAPWRDICLGGVLEGGYQNEGGFWIDPLNGDPILAHEAHGLVRVDLRNGNSMRFSF